MIDTEVIRLRRLRRAAMRARAVARSLSCTERTSEERVLSRAACTSWRIARTVSGRLRAHPYPVYQRDETLPALLGHALAARRAAAKSATRDAALRTLGECLHALAREVDDTRALTRCSDLSDALGRSQLEVRELLCTVAGPHTSQLRAATPLLATPPLARPKPAALGHIAAVVDWPYVQL